MTIDEKLKSTEQQVEKLIVKYGNADEQFEKIKEEIKEDIQMGEREYDLKNVCRNAPNVTQKYIEYYHIQKRRLNKLKTHQYKVNGLLFEKYFKYFEIKLSATDANTFMRRDDLYKKMSTIIIEQEFLSEFLMDTVKNFTNRGFQIQNMVKLADMESR